MRAPDDHRLAAELATRAGAHLLELRGRHPDAASRRQALRDRGDASSHRLLMAALAEARPDDAVLSEEGKDDPARLLAERVWIVDPVDGTREFGEVHRSDWAVHVALWEQGDLAVGAVALPALGVTLATGAESPPPRAAADRRRRVVVSRTRPPAIAEQVARALDAELVALGSAGAKAMAVVRGEADAYVHGGGMYEWDSAAPVAVARAAGLHCSRLDGAVLRYNQPDPYLPDLLVCRPELVERILAVTA